MYTIWPVIVAGVSVVMDIREARIDNGWICFSMCMGFILQLLQGGAGSLIPFAAGTAVPLVLLGILFYFRMLGPGDIKLFCALGGVMGIRDIVWCIAVSFLLGAVISVAILIFCGDIRQRFQYFFRYFQEFLHTGERKPYYRKGMALENFHFTVPVFLSVVLYAGGVY